MLYGFTIPCYLLDLINSLGSLTISTYGANQEVCTRFALCYLLLWFVIGRFRLWTSRFFHCQKTAVQIRFAPTQLVQIWRNNMDRRITGNHWKWWNYNNAMDNETLAISYGINWMSGRVLLWIHKMMHLYLIKSYNWVHFNASATLFGQT